MSRLLRVHDAHGGVRERITHAAHTPNQIAHEITLPRRLDEAATRRRRLVYCVTRTDVVHTHDVLAESKIESQAHACTFSNCKCIMGRAIAVHDMQTTFRPT